MKKHVFALRISNTFTASPRWNAYRNALRSATQSVGTRAKAIDTILSDYVHTHQKQNTPFDKLCFELDMADEEIDDLFKRDKDTGRTLEL